MCVCRSYVLRNITANIIISIIASGIICTNNIANQGMMVDGGQGLGEKNITVNYSEF